jgi:hypothetical protein
MKPGDLIWQQRMPGGVCILVNIFYRKEEYDIEDEEFHIWTPQCWPVIRLLHPEEGMIDDPQYYYSEIHEDALIWERQKEK